MEAERGEDGTGVGTSSDICTVAAVLSVSDRGFVSVVPLLLEVTLKNDEDSLLRVAVRVVAPEGRLGRSLSFSAGIPPSFSFSFSRYNSRELRTRDISQFLALVGQSSSRCFGDVWALAESRR